MGATVFELMQECLGRRYGAGLWETVVASGGTGRDEPSDALVAWLGGEGVRLLAERYPSLLAKHRDSRSFLRSLADDVPAAETPRPSARPGVSFRFQPALDGDLLVGVNGAGRLCALLQGMLGALSVHYDERLRLVHMKCSCRGDNRCVMRVGRAGVPEAAEAPAAGARARLA